MRMGVKLALLVIFVSSVVTLNQPCKYSHDHKLTQVTCSNFNATTKWHTHLPSGHIDKLLFNNITGSLDLTNVSLTSLKFLQISNSKLDDVKWTWFPNLVFLAITKNEKFPDVTRDVFTHTAHVNWLALISNNHTIAPDALHFLKNLTWLHIENQKFEHLTSEFLKENTKLHEVTIRNCHLQHVDADAFDKATELEILSMNFNNIKFFEAGTFKNLRKLKILELHHNTLLDFSLEQFRGLRSLEVLGLPSNFLRNVDSSDSLLGAFPSLQKLEVKKGDLVSYNSVKQLVKELRKKGVHIIGTPHDCHSFCNVV